MPSTVVKSIEFNVETSTLRITFISGMIYNYKDVPEDVYIALKT